MLIYDFFGKKIGVEYFKSRYKIYILTDTLKVVKKTYELSIPRDVKKEDIAQYLDDMYHEKGCGNVVFIFEKPGISGFSMFS